MEEGCNNIAVVPNCYTLLPPSYSEWNYLEMDSEKLFSASYNYKNEQAKFSLAPLKYKIKKVDKQLQGTHETIEKFSPPLRALFALLTYW